MATQTEHGERIAILETLVQSEQEWRREQAARLDRMEARLAHLPYWIVGTGIGAVSLLFGALRIWGV